MKQELFMEKYPIFSLQLSKSECRYSDVDQLLGYFKEQIDSHPVAAFIGEFDHYAHTDEIGGEISPHIKAAKMVVFCFGQKLPKPEMLAARPRSIGVSDLGESFVFTFLEAPVSTINDVIEGWIKQTKTA